MTEVNSIISVITINGILLDTSVERHKLSEQIKIIQPHDIYRIDTKYRKIEIKEIDN